jgi:hypothetical protein
VKLFKRKSESVLMDAKNAEEAVDYGLKCLKWFLIHKFKITALILLVFFGSALFVALRYFYKPSGIDRHSQPIEKVIKP